MYLKYPGHIYQNNEVKLMDDNLISVNEFSILKNKKDIRQLFGKINFLSQIHR